MPFQHYCFLAFLNCPFGRVSQGRKHKPVTMTNLEADILKSLSSASIPNLCLSFYTHITLLGIQPHNILNDLPSALSSEKCCCDQNIFKKIKVKDF